MSRNEKDNRGVDSKHQEKPLTQEELHQEQTKREVQDLIEALTRWESEGGPSHSPGQYPHTERNQTEDT